MDKIRERCSKGIERQTEELNLLAKELQIQRGEKTIKSKRGEMNVLQDNLKTVTDDINALEKTRINYGRFLEDGGRV